MIKDYFRPSIFLLAILLTLALPFFSPFPYKTITDIEITINRPDPINLKDDTITICNPIGRPEWGNPFIFTNYKYTDNGCDHYTFFRPISFILDLLICLIIVNIIRKIITFTKNKLVEKSR